MRLIGTILISIIYFSSCFSQSFADTTFINLFKQNGGGWNAGDGTISIALPDGRTLWMFGDSHVDQGVDALTNEIPCLFNTRNSLMIQDQANNFTTLYDESGTDLYSRQFVKIEGDTAITYWPAGGVVYDDIVYSFWERYDINGPLDISFLGMAVAEMSLLNMDLISVTSLNNRSLEFGMTIVADETSGYHYIYGRQNDGVFRQAFVARCSLGEFYSEYEIYAGNGNWVSDLGDAEPILDNVSNSFTVFQCGETYYLLTQERGFLQCGEGREIYMYESATPYGPFENQKVVYTVEDQFEGVYPITYNAQAHPQFTENGVLLVSYNLNLTCPGPCAASPITSKFNADMYRPKFARVPISSNCTMVSTEDMLSTTAFKVYPNPVRQHLYIDCPIDVTDEQIYYQLYDVLGILRRVGKFYNAIDLQDLEKGIYLLRIRSNGYEYGEIIYKL